MYTTNKPNHQNQIAADGPPIYRRSTRRQRDNGADSQRDSRGAEGETRGRADSLGTFLGNSLNSLAVKYVEEWRVVEFVKDANSRLGLAPSTEAILQKMEANRLQLPTHMQPESKGTAAEAKARISAEP